MEISIYSLFIPVLIGIVLAVATRNIEKKKATKIQIGVWILTGFIFMSVWFFTM